MDHTNFRPFLEINIPISNITLTKNEKAFTFSHLTTGLLSLILLLLASCNRDEDPSVAQVNTYKRAITQEDLSQALLAGARIEFYNTTSLANPLPYYKKMEQEMTNYLAEQAGSQLNQDYAKLKESNVMKTLENYFAEDREQTERMGRLSAEQLAVVQNMLNQTGLSAPAKTTIINLYNKIEESGELTLLQAEANAILANSTDNKAMKDQIRSLLSQYEQQVVKDTALTTRDKEIIFQMSTSLLNNLDTQADHMRKVILEQAASGRWRPKTIFGKILRATINSVISITVCTVAGMFGVPLPVPFGGPQGLSGAEMGFLVGVAWSVYMIVEDDYLI